MDSSMTLVFIITAFSLGAVIVWKKDTIPQQLRKFMALTTLGLVLFAFFLIVYSFITLGSAS
ncbi:hypothetical protein [Paenibacillus agilis]|uniref:Signal transduction histidine kinase n=1 Tax=Paenibacillus agilis TaxID=3020863 RepID=A0A559IY69_9BACL|nr:hypothetical protein [Paenibacillus agilis]TVX92573.1 hypothetical protein FPZ44_05585 [Paenibacillus agilis]